MKLKKIVSIFLLVALATTKIFSQANPSIAVAPSNSGQVAVGATNDLTIAVGNTGAGTIAVSKLRPIVTIPASVTFLANAFQTGLPAGWTILSNTGSQLRLCNSGFIVPGASSTSIILKVQGVTITAPQTFSGQINFGNGTTCAAGPSVAGNNTADDFATSTIEVIAAAPCTIAVSASAGTVACNGGTTTLTATATGAAGTVEYSLNGGAYQLSNTFTVDAAGSPYTVTAREVDVPACTATATAVTVTQPAAVTTTAAVSAAIVAAGGTGSITASATGGTGTATYVITSGTTINTTGAASGIFTGLLAGTYVITATDANACTGVSNSVLLADGAACTIAVSATAGTIACNGGTTTLTVTATGTSNTVEYSLNGGAYQLSNTFTVDAAGSPYTVTTREVATPACTATATAVTVTEPTAVTLSAAVTSSITTSGGTGTITVTANGGTPAFTYVITSGTTINTTGATSGVFSNLSSGNYTFSASDSRGCLSPVTSPVFLSDFPPLPVTLLNFAVSLVNCKPTINWVTEAEINSDRFEIERANQNTTDWLKVGTATAQGNSAIKNKYNFNDNTVLASTPRVLYRLKMIDKDGKYKYSPVLPVFINCKTTQVNIYPNPVQNGLLNVNLISIDSKGSEAILVNAVGQVVLKMNLKNGFNTVNVSNIASGEYVLKVNAVNGVSKVLIQNK